MYWHARFESPDGECLYVDIAHTPDHYNEEYGIMVTAEMEAKRLAERQNRKAAERYDREPYKLVILECRD